MSQPDINVQSSLAHMTTYAQATLNLLARPSVMATHRENNNPQVQQILQLIGLQKAPLNVETNQIQQRHHTTQHAKIPSTVPQVNANLQQQSFGHTLHQVNTIAIPDIKVKQ